MQPVAGNAVVADERGHPFARPVEQWVHLDEPVVRIDRSVGHAGPLHRLVGAQPGDPRRSTGKGASERLDLAHRAAGVAGRRASRRIRLRPGARPALRGLGVRGRLRECAGSSGARSRPKARRSAETAVRYRG